MTSADEDFGSRRRRGDGRRGHTHAKTSPRWPDGGTGPFAAQETFEAAPPRGGDPRFGRQDPRWPDAAPPAYQDAGPPAYQDDYYQAEYPGWTQRPGYRAEYPEIPGWTGQQQAEYPEWSGQPAYPAEYPGWSERRGNQGEHPGWAQPPGYQEGYPGWTEQPAVQGGYLGQPGPYGQYALHPDHPSWPESQFAPWPGEAPVIDHRPSTVTMAPPLPNRERRPFTPQPDFPPRADAAAHTLAPRRDLPLHRDMDFYSAPIMPDTITDVANWAQPDAAYAQPAREQIWDAGSSQLANWIIEDANEQAAEIFRQARSHASSSLADAQREAAELVRRTGEQAKLTIEAAELQASEIRATMMKLTTDLTGMASYVTQNLTAAPPASAPPASAPPAFAPPATDRAAPPIAVPAAEPAGQPAAAAPARPAGGPRVQPATAAGVWPARQPAAAPTARPGAKPNGKSRQHAAVRVMTIFTAAMVVFALTAGASEVALHGFKFFVFRSTGTGETGPNGGQEDQGPGQPDAPGAHQQVQKP
jgi:hypothetical protein